MALENSILRSIKTMLSLEPDYDVFDQDILIHINSTFATLRDLGIGPLTGFMIEDDSITWNDYLGADAVKYSNVKSYIYLRVRMFHDPPDTSFHIAAMNERIREEEWRLMVAADKPISAIEAEGAFWWDIDGSTGFPPEAEVGDLGYDPRTGMVYRKIA